MPMPTLPGLSPMMTLAKPPPTVEHLGNHVETVLAGNATVTITGANLGNPGAKRLIVVMCSSYGGDPVDSVTVGGTSLTFINHSTGGYGVAISTFAGFVPTGTSANIVLVDATSPSYGECGIRWFAIHNCDSATPVHTASTITNGATVNLSTVADGVIIAGAESYIDAVTTMACPQLTEAAGGTLLHDNVYWFTCHHWYKNGCTGAVEPLTMTRSPAGGYGTIFWAGCWR